MLLGLSKYPSQVLHNTIIPASLISYLTFLYRFVILTSVIVLRKLAKPVTGGRAYRSLPLLIYKSDYYDEKILFISCPVYSSSRTVPPGMSGHCHKKYAAFFHENSLKPHIYVWRTLYIVTKWVGRMLRYCHRFLSFLFVRQYLIYSIGIPQFLLVFQIVLPSSFLPVSLGHYASPS